MILNTFPKADDFYKNYWGKKPFIVKKAIPEKLFEDLIDPDHLAGLALEEDIQSRIVTRPQDGQNWLCEHGPFQEDIFAQLSTKNWSLLVQNVEDYHPDTGKLLNHFNFSPRWLMDDIMVSYSVVGGGVGPHIDSYHVFLVQGIGKRKWTIGCSASNNNDCIAGLDLKVLKEDIEGEDIETSIGDVIYIPPNFVHQGITTQEAMTFSAGFLGPKISELLIEYGYYLEQNDRQNIRYNGDGLNTDSAGSLMPHDAQKDLQEKLVNSLELDSFYIWLNEYFSKKNN